MKFDDEICKGVSCPECSFNKGEDGCLLAKRLDEIEIIPEPCDLISRQAAIDEAEEWIETYNSERGGQRERDAINHVISGIKKLPSAQPEPHYDEWCTDCKEYDHERHCCPRWNRVIRETLKDAQPEQRWIPCSERLPDNNRQVLVYALSVHFALAKYDEMREADGTYKKQWVTFDAWKPFYKIKDVIAWMPLPEPYKGGREE